MKWRPISSFFSHHINRLLLITFHLYGAVACSINSSTRPALDPADPFADQTTTQTMAQPLSQGIYTGADLIGEVQGRKPPSEGSEQAHSGHKMSGPEKVAPGPDPVNSSKVIPAQYTCPMHPEIVQDHPGKCPKCGMNLVPRKPKEE